MSALVGICARMGNGPHAITRSEAGARDARGVWQPGATSELSIACAVFPGATSDELLSLLEGRRVEDVVTIYSETPLRSDAAGPDRLTYLGRVYTVIGVATYQSARGATLYVALASKEDIP